MLIEIGSILLGSMIGMIIDRHPSSKSFLRYETFFSTIPAIMPPRPCEINEMILVLFPLRNTTFEVVLGLSVPVRAALSKLKKNAFVTLILTSLRK